MSPHTVRTFQQATLISGEYARPASATAAPDAAARSILPAILLVAGTIALVCAMFWVHALAPSDCHVRPVHFVFGVTSEIAATVPAGVPCVIALKTGSAPVDALSIDLAPRFGTLAARGRTGVIYHPSSRTPGHDEFAFSIHGDVGHPAQKATVRVHTDAK